MAESLTQKWLRQNTQSYAQKDIVYAHADAVLRRYQAIRPKTDIYTYDDGRTQLLLCLHGLLPITYRGSPYNIPIAVWLTKDYPRQPPIAYVVPTTDMLVRPSKYIDVSGKCGIEYVRNWERKSEGCNLLALLEAMQDHFSREPPVYAKPKPSPTPQPQQSRTPASGADYSARPPPPVPPVHPASPPLSQAASSGNDDRPPLPLKPPSTAVSSPSVAPSAPAPSAHPSMTGPVHAKLTSELASLEQVMALDAERLRALQNDLLAGEPAIRDEMARLEAVRDVCQGVAARLRAVVSDGERNVAELKRKGDPDVDELVCSTTIVHNQLINLVAEDNAIEDTMYHLHRALNSGRIDLERFLRTTRVLAEEQFIKRALIEKILNGLPMGETMDWR
ncbi:UEV-domain-containing protein [Panus rudis PR-1116 ss-1]|nr:UEV-domain-containing protein [Panus rudis PR-1116 ss-1]